MTAADTATAASTKIGRTRGPAVTGASGTGAVANAPVFCAGSGVDGRTRGGAAGPRRPTGGSTRGGATIPASPPRLADALAPTTPAAPVASAGTGMPPAALPADGNRATVASSSSPSSMCACALDGARSSEIDGSMVGSAGSSSATMSEPLTSPAGGNEPRGASPCSAPSI
jgi:hypothetical protein